MGGGGEEKKRGRREKRERTEASKAVARLLPVILYTR